MDLIQNDMLKSWIIVEKPEDHNEPRPKMLTADVSSDIIELCETEEELAELLRLLSINSNNTPSSVVHGEHDQNGQVDQRNTENNNNNTKRRRKALPPAQAVYHRIRYEIKRLKRCQEVNNTNILYYRTRSDLYCVPLEVGSMATRPFGFHFLQRVNTPKGLATVLGVYRGCLFVHVDHEAGASFWDNGSTHKDLLQIGFLVADSQSPFQPTLEKIAECLVKSTQLNLLNFTHMIEWHDVESAAQLRDQPSSELIETYFQNIIKCDKCNTMVERHRVCTQQILELLDFYYDKKDDKWNETGRQPTHLRPATPFANDIHSYYYPKHSDMAWLEELKRQIKVKHNPGLYRHSNYSPSSESPATGWSGTYYSNPSTVSSDHKPYSSPGVSYSRNLQCPFCQKSFSETIVDEHVVECAQQMHSANSGHPDDTLPGELDFKNDIERFTFRRLADMNNVSLAHRAPSRVPALWACSLAKIATMGPEVILQLFAVAGTVELTPAVNAAVKKMCLAHVRPNFDKLSLDQLREIPQEEREMLILEKLEADPQSIGTKRSLAHFLNTNISLEHTTVLKVVQRLLTVEVLVSLFELYNTEEEFLESDALRNYTQEQLRKIDLLKLQDSPTFQQLNKYLQDALIQLCLSGSESPVKTKNEEFLYNPFDEMDDLSDESFMSDEEDQEEDQEEEEE